MLTLILLYAAIAAPITETPDFVEAWRSKVDWQQAGDESAEVLSAYLQVDTVNPSGNEARGVRFLVEQLAADGIRATEYPLEGFVGRSNLVARLRGTTDAPPLCLLSHIDVVTSEPERWSSGHAPLSGDIADGKVWGRGALDMKGMGVVELQAMRWLARLGVPLARDVILIAVADEEVDGHGMEQLVERHWSDVRCGDLINEGGLGVRDALFDGQTLHAISIAEKGVVWGKLIATGNPGHGSTIDPNEAPAHLLAAMNHLDKKYRDKAKMHPALRDLLRASGAQKGGIYKVVLRSSVLRGLLVRPKLEATPGTSALLHNTLHLTGMAGAQQPNVVPSEVYALYDSRIRPDTSPEQQRDKLERLIAKHPNVRWQWLALRPANESPSDDPFFHKIAHYAVEGRPTAAVGPVLSPGFTDSLFARPLGVRAYGYVPFELTEAEANTMHGHDEHVSVENLREGTRRMFSLLVHAAGTGEVPPEP